MAGPDKKKVAGKPRVIITEDEMHLRELFKVMMVALNTDVVALAANGHEAVEYYRKVRPHLMLLDINLPGKTGDEALEEIMAEFPHAFVIMLTSVSDLETVKKCLDLGASNYILKDTPISEMKEIIKSTWKTRLEKMRKRRRPGPKKAPAPPPAAHRAPAPKAPPKRPDSARSAVGAPPPKNVVPARRPKGGAPIKPAPPGTQTGRPVKPTGAAPVKRRPDRRPPPPGSKSPTVAPSGVKPNGPTHKRPAGTSNPPLKKPVSGQGPSRTQPGIPGRKKTIKKPSDK